MKLIIILILIIFSNELYSNVIVHMKKHINTKDKSSEIIRMTKIKEIDLLNSINKFQKEKFRKLHDVSSQRVYYNSADKSVIVENIDNYNQLIISDFLGNIILNINIIDYKSNSIPVSLNRGVYFIILFDNNRNK